MPGKPKANLRRCYDGMAVKDMHQHTSWSSQELLICTTVGSRQSFNQIPKLQLLALVRSQSSDSSVTGSFFTQASSHLTA